MNTKTLAAMAVASTFTWAGGVLAHGTHHSTEVQTPASVSESAPWLTGQSMASAAETSMPSNERIVDSSIGSTSSVGSLSTGGYDSTLSSTERVDYWLLGDDAHGIGASASASGYGSGSFASSNDMSSSVSSSMSDQSYGTLSALSDSSPDIMVSEVYLVPAPLASFDGDGYWTMALSPGSDSFDRLATISDLYVITPIYEVLDVSALDAGSNEPLALQTSNDLPASEFAG